jgi:ketosteroid isomerase-like protein
VPVSERDVAHVRRAFEAFDLQALRDGALPAYFEEFYDDEAVVEPAEGFPVSAERRVGAAGYQQWFDDAYGPYEDVRWSVDDVRAVGHCVVVLARVAGRPKGDQTELEVRLALVYRLRAGRIAHVRVFLTPDRAFEAAEGGMTDPSG